MRFFAEGAKPQNRAFFKIKPKIQTQNSYTFPNPRVRFWKGVGRWWARRAVYGWLLVGSRQGKQGYRTQLFPFIASLAPSVWSSVSTVSETPDTEKNKKRLPFQDQNPPREICRPTFLFRACFKGVLGTIAPLSRG